MAQKIAETIEESMVPMPAPIPEGLVSPTPEALLIEGGVATGKTQALVDRAAALLAGGADPADVVVFCATPDAAARFRDRLGRRCPAAGGEIRVTTVREWCLDALGSEGVRSATGRGGRLLAPFEADMLMEDLKTCGVRPRRLKEMLRFFYKSLTELCDWNEDWLLTGEEETVYGMLRDCLAFTGGILEPELANTVARYLFAGGAGAASLVRPHVLVDDYQTLSRASQVLVNRLAGASIAVAANPALCVEVFDSYPYGNGVREFGEANPRAERTVLDASLACGAAARAVDGIAARAGLDGVPPVSSGRPGELEVLHAENPSLESRAVAETVLAALAGGAEPADVAVIAPNRVWSRAMAAAIEAAGVPVEEPLPPQAASGDPRELDRCSVSRMLTALNLVADPGDGVAWRCWCGFGDHFTCSSALRDVRNLAAGDQGGAAMGVAEALAAFASSPCADSESRAERGHVEKAREAALGLIGEASSKTGEDLLLFIARTVGGEGSEVPYLLRSLTAPLPDGRFEGDGAPAMAARARRRLNAPRLEPGNRVLVASLDDVTGLTPKTLVLCGFVNGFFPSRGVLDRSILVQEDADKQVAKDVRRLMNAVGKATESLTVTVFDEVELETAERTGMKIRRIQLHDGRRVALSQESEYLAFIR